MLTEDKTERGPLYLPDQSSSPFSQIHAHTWSIHTWYSICRARMDRPLLQRTPPWLCREICDRAQRPRSALRSGSRSDAPQEQRAHPAACASTCNKTHHAKARFSPWIDHTGLGGSDNPSQAGPHQRGISLQRPRAQRQAEEGACRVTLGIGSHTLGLLLSPPSSAQGSLQGLGASCLGVP